ncbi:MAG: YggT family protein [Dehalococcoidia bacterium]|nr:YggT family protein [Dehalococcoidia bacterium]
MDPVRLILNFFWYLTQAMTYAIVGRAILSWFPISPTNPLVQILDQITEPFLTPLRKVVPRVGMIDITPMVAIFILWAIQGVLAGVMR